MILQIDSATQVAEVMILQIVVSSTTTEVMIPQMDSATQVT